MVVVALGVPGVPSICWASAAPAMIPIATPAIHTAALRIFIG
jgi:hypothetical protein